MVYIEFVSVEPPWGTTAIEEPLADAATKMRQNPTAANALIGPSLL
jgi:hypothetical protein